MSRRISTSTVLRVPGLAAVRVVWVVLAVLSLTFFVIGVPAALSDAPTRLGIAVDADSLTAPYPIRQAADLTRVLDRLGVSERAYAWYSVLLNVVQVLGCALVGWTIFWRRSDDWFELLISLMLVVYGIGSVTYIRPPWDAAARFLYVLGGMLVVFCLFLFPDGRFVPRWAWLASLGGAIRWLVYLLPKPYHPIRWPPSPSHFVGLFFHAIGVMAQIHRYRHVSSSVQRQQTKWVVLGITIASVGIYGCQLYGYISRFGLVPWLMQSERYLYLYITFWQPIKILAFLMVPLSIGISVLRYRLWDIDLVISRGLVYGTLTALLGALFAGSLFAISQISDAWTGRQQYGIAMSCSALVFGILFQPVRRRMQRFVDRHLYGIQIDYQPEAVSPDGIVGQLGRRQLGTYTNLEYVGCGGMAEVYRAYQPTLDCTVAIKILFPHFIQESSVCRRFEREAQAVRQLDHPNIVRALEGGEIDGRPYIVMEYISGPNLGHYIEEHGRLPLAQVSQIVHDVASALDYAHQHGMIHRDVKPSNIMLDPTLSSVSREFVYRAVVTDFGLARVLGESTRTSRSGVLGTLSYIAPEQIQSPESVDGRADIYALAVTAYQMLTGELPFRYHHPGALLIAHLTQPPPDPRDLVPDFPDSAAKALQRALSKRPETRYATAGDFARAMIPGQESFDVQPDMPIV